MKGKKGKKDLQQQAQIGGGCTADEGLLALTVCTKTKVERGKKLFPCLRIVPPLWLRGPLPFGPYPHAPSLFRILQLPSPSRCVWCQLDKFSFFFSPFIWNLCRTMSTAISPSPPPTPVTATSTLPLPHQSRSRYNRHHATLALTLTCVAGHTQATSPPSLSLGVFFSSFYFILVISLFISN